MESPISRNFIDDYAFKQMIKNAREAQIKKVNEKIGNVEDTLNTEISKETKSTSKKDHVKAKFKALKNARKKI